MPRCVDSRAITMSAITITLVKNPEKCENPGMLRVNNNIEIPLSELNFSFARSGGPGGQNVNKVNSKAVLHWDVTTSESLSESVRRRFVERYRQRLTNDGAVVIHSQRYRDQGRNVSDCMDKLREMILTVAAAPVKRRPTRPTRGANQRRLQSKKQNSEKKQTRRKPTTDS